MQINKKLLWLEKILYERFGHYFTLDVDNKDNLILTLRESKHCITFLFDQHTFERTDSEMPFCYWDPSLEGWEALMGVLPAPGSDSLQMPLISSAANGMHIAYDIMGLTYWMLTRKEEVGRTDLDEHGRFPATSSHALKHGYLERPVVDEWLHILGQVIQRTWIGIELKKHCFSIKVSHDVDHPTRYGFRSIPSLVRTMVVDVLKRRDFNSAILAPWIRMNTRTQLHPSDPANTFEWIMDLSEKHGLQSAFYFICGHTDPHDADYDIKHPAIRDLMRRIHQRGHEIGLHPSYGTYQEPALIQQEADYLRKVCYEEGITQKEWGGRMHYLRWESLTTLRAWAAAGLSYDSTLGYADHPGFRCGTCFDYPAFDHVTGETLATRIRPLIVMEDTILSKNYLGLGAGELALQKFMHLKQTCQSVSGCFTLLWHNCQLQRNIDRELYRLLIK